MARWRRSPPWRKGTSTGRGPSRCGPRPPVPAGGRKPYHRDADGAVWRVYPFIAGAKSREHVRTPDRAREVGRAFGAFQRLLADYAGPRLTEAIPHFPDTPRRLEALE